MRRFELLLLDKDEISVRIRVTREARNGGWVVAEMEKRSTVLLPPRSLVVQHNWDEEDGNPLASGVRKTEFDSQVSDG